MSEPKESRAQMPMRFLTDVLRLITRLDGVYMDDDTKALCKSLESQIGAKIDAMDRRRTFTEYKTAEKGTAERENKRLEYLEKKEVHPDWRTSKEQSL